MKIVEGDKVLGKKLRDFRQSKQKNQQQFATELNINRSYLSEIETGSSPISDALREKIERAINAGYLSDSGIVLTGSVAEKAKELVGLLKFDNVTELVFHLIRVEYERTIKTRTPNAQNGDS